jgi:NAD(P)H-dependent flavin oxidoreductase YrpB (nitropropane dioxygenase family)
VSHPDPVNAQEGDADVPVPMRTRFTELVGVDYPVVQEGLGPYRSVALPAAVSNAGGLGTLCIPGLTEGVELGSRHLREFIEELCTLTDKPFAVNVPVGTASDGEVLPFSRAYVQTVIDAVKDPEIALRLRAITTSAGPPGVVRDVIADSGLVHIHKVGGTRQALRAQQDGVDVILASGYEAGGHTHSRPVHTFILVPSVAEAVDVPVVLAGGARDGRSLAASLAMGADAVAMGTRFVAARENTDWHPAYAEAILAAREGDDVIFEAIYGPSRALPSHGIEELAELVASGGMDVHELTAWKDQRLIGAMRDGKLAQGLLPAGQVSGAIDDWITVADFVPAVVREARAIIDDLHVRLGGAAISEETPDAAGR